MPGRVEEKVKLVCVKLKPNDTPDKVKSKLLKTLRNAEKKDPELCSIGHPLESFCEEVHCISELNVSDVVEVASNSRYIVFLLRDGRACRMRCTSKAETHSKVTADLLKRPKQSSFQVLSDAEYARQLQAQFNAEGGTRSLFEGSSLLGNSSSTAGNTGRGSGPSSASPSVDLVELDRRTREYMYLGSIPSPEYRRDPEYYRTLARELSHEGEMVTGMGTNVFETRNRSPPSPFPPLSLIEPISPTSPPQAAPFSVEGDASGDPVLPIPAITPPPAYETLSVASSAPTGVSGGPPTGGGEGRDSGRLLGATGSQGGSGGGVGGAGGGASWRSRKVQWPEMGTLEWAVSKQNPDQPSSDSTFVAMATLHSEILLVGADSRQLYSWPCEDGTPGHSHTPLSPSPHPLSDELGLSSERIALVSTSDVRATVVTETGKVATFYDALLRDCSKDVPPALVRSLTHPVTELPEVEPDGGGGGGDRIVQLSVANFLTTAVTETGKVYWWGLCPQGKKGGSSDDNSSGRMTGVRSSGTSFFSSRGAITDGGLVRMKNGPPCGPNAMVYTRSPTHGPRVGKTVNIMEHGRLDPKTTVLVKVFKSDVIGLSRKGSRDSGRGSGVHGIDDSDRYDGLEVWKLSDVVFLGDSPSVLGRVVTIDQQQVIVDVSYSENVSSNSQATSSSSKSTLKVFRLSELEPCVDSSKASDLPGRSKVKSKKTGSLPSSQQSLSGTKSVSQHVAGIVQHRPTVMLDPTAAAPATSGDSFSPEDSTPMSKIVGYKPLAVHATDEGPTLLLQRIADGRAFLVCSSHASSGAFVSTSFVAVGTKDSKPTRCTVEEESVDAFQSGLAVDRLKDSSGLLLGDDAHVAHCGLTSSKSVLMESEAGTGDSKNREKQRQGSPSGVKAGRKRKSRSRETTSEETHVATSSALHHSEPTPLPSFVSCFGSQVLLLLDVNGMVWPLANGLRLRPPSDRKHAFRAPPQPLRPYASIVSRQHAASKEENVLVFVLVPRSQVLMPAVLAGNMTKVQSILNHLTTQVQVPVHLNPDSESLDSDFESTSTPAKKVRLSSSPCDGTSPDTEMVEVPEIIANPPLPGKSSEVENLPKLLDSQNDHQSSLSQSALLHQDSEEASGDNDVNKPAPKRIRFSEPDAALPAPKPRKPTPFSALDLVKPSERPQPLFCPPATAEQWKPVMSAPVLAQSDRGAEQILKIDFDQQMPVVENEAVSVSRTGAESSPTLTQTYSICSLVKPSVIKEMKVSSPGYGLDVLREATVHNSNILHVCCQMEGGRKVEGTGSKGEELREATDSFRPLTVNHLHYQSITCLPEFQNKSFEELRHHSQQEGPTPFPTHHDGKGWSLGQRRMAILEKFLTCKEIRPTIIKLLCSKNAEGSTPFMTAVSQRNYSAALRLLRFVEEVDQEQLQDSVTSAPTVVLPMETEESETKVSGQGGMERDQSADRASDKVEAKPEINTRRRTDQTLLEKAILACMGAGITPVHAVLASLSPFYDSVSMCLHVSSIPVTFSAQHLLKLFQSRYPSAYKAEIFRQGSSVSSSSSESDSDLSDNEDGQTGLGGAGGGGTEPGGRGYRPFSNIESRTRSRMAQLRRNRARRRRRHRQNTTSLFGASAALPQSGVIHFSDVAQLRAASREMHEFRLASSVTRNTGFGHTQSISFLGVRLEPESDGDSDDEGEGRNLDRLPFDEYPPITSLPGSGRGREEGEGLGARKRSAREAQHANKIATHRLAHQLLLKLLAHPRVATAMGQIGETAVASLVHNPKCLSVLSDIRRGIQKGADSHGRDTSGSSGRGVSSLSEWLQSRREHDSSQSGTSATRFAPRARVSQHVRVVPQFGEELHQLISDTVSSVASVLPSLLESHNLPPRNIPRFGFGVPRLVQPHPHSASTPIGLSAAQHQGRFTLSDFQLQPQSGSLAAEILITTSPFISQSSSDRDDSRYRPRDGIRTSEETQSIPPNRSGTEAETQTSQTSVPLSSNQLRFSSTLGSGFGNRPGAPGMESRPEGAQSQAREGQTTSDTESSHAVPLTPAAQECDMLLPLITNWPCIVTTILGFYPEEEVQVLSKADGSVPGPSRCTGKLLPVYLLDSFTTNLVLNCEDAVIDKLVAVIVEKMNEAFENCSSDDNASAKILLDNWSPQDCSLSELTGSTLALIVGKRFLNSVMRVLALEHSRVKNALHELQQERMGGGGAGGGAGGRNLGGSGRGGGGGERQKRKNVLNTVKRVIVSFSWLAVHSLAESAEASAAPVRLGVSKPLGAHSVSADYHMPRSITPSSFRSSRQNEDPNQVLARQLHVRSALSTTPTTTSEALSLSASSPASVTRPTGMPLLPRDGLLMRPNTKDPTGGSNISHTSDMAAGISIHDDNFEDFDSEGHDLSDQEQEMEGFGHTESIRTGRVGQVGFVRHTPIPVGLAQAAANVIHEVHLDLDTESSSDDEYSIVDDPFGEPSVTWNNGQVSQEDTNLDDIYPFAWALDGRRIGEQNVRSNRPTSPNMLVFGAPSEPTIPLCTIPSIRFGAGFLARTFARFVKDLVDIAQMICDKKAPQPSVHLPHSLSHRLISSSVSTLERTWQWVISVLDVAEGQLQQGQLFDSQRYVLSLRGSGYSAGNRPMVRIPPRSFIGSTPGEYITYLLRSHTQEHAQSLPVTDLYGYEHVVYMLDGLIYTLTNWPREATTFASDSNSPIMTSSTQPTNQSMEDDVLVSKPKPRSSSAATSQQPGAVSEATQGSRFFVRTESVIIGEEDPDTQKSNQQFFGPQGASLQKPDFVGPPNSWGSQVESLSRPLNEVYPLAQQPHLLKPFAKKEHLFSSPPSRKGSLEEGRGNEGGGRLPVSYAEQRSDPPSGHPITVHWTIEHALQRWRLAISVFAHIFLAEGPGSERSNFLNARAGFASRMARFRHQVSQLFDASQSSRDWASTVSSTFSLRIRRDHLLQDAIESLQQMLRFHYSQIRVKFEGEEGSGPGVNRGFFASLANELKSNDPLKVPMQRLGLFFHEPGKQPEQNGLFAPLPFIPSAICNTLRTASIKADRKNVFRAIGRFLGLCLWFKYTIPFMVCRHVAKFLLERDLAWHDLAFYNADLYEGLRRMMLDAEEGRKGEEEFMATYCCYFEVPLTGTVEPVLVDLIPSGSKIPVTPERVQEYVRLYAMFMMVGCVKDELQAMKEGLTDIIPTELLAGLTAEDFQLLLSGGSANITLSRLKSVIKFNHTHGSTAIICERFEKMFWRVVSHMNNTQRQQLLYFATGSAALPAGSDSSDRAPALSITIDVIGGGNTESLPVASTCSQRMSLPLYPSYHILKKKLLQAIQCQAYGLG